MSACPHVPINPVIAPLEKCHWAPAIRSRFLAGNWLKAEAILRGQLLGQVVSYPDVIEDWPALLSACCGSAETQGTTKDTHW